MAAFLSLAHEEGFWEDLEQESVWTTVLSLEPESPYRYIQEEKLEDIALSFADFADLKSPYAAGHSRRVGDLAERIGQHMRLPSAEVAIVRQAALMHDLGLVAVPSFTLHKPHDQRTQLEREQVRLHPYHAERILSRVPVLAPMVPLVAAHHERLDGHGYYRGLRGAQIPLGARIIAVADRFDDFCHDTPDQPALDPAVALERMRAEVGSALCPDAYEALVRELRVDAPDARGRRTSHPR
ncbi:MAG TPA: HD domain-containing phosphohydrolase, partial [Ktedonobacterales bacterium]|nr:HD domain-containing phosphohydrolase [Ktedonobacterales bacterium]